MGWVFRISFDVCCWCVGFQIADVGIKNSSVCQQNIKIEKQLLHIHTYMKLHMESSGTKQRIFTLIKPSLDLNETGPDSVRISRNKLGYYSGLAVVPNDVVICLRDWGECGKSRREEGWEPIPGEWSWSRVGFFWRHTPVYLYEEVSKHYYLYYL